MNTSCAFWLCVTQLQMRDRLLKITLRRIKDIMQIDAINVKNKQLSDQLKYLFSLSNLDLFY